MASTRHPRTQGGFRAAFFLCLAWLQACTGLALADQATPPLHAHPVWHALLHIKAGSPQVQDPGFILSLPHFSPERELQATLDALQGPHALEALCRFPARALWLHEQGLLPPPDTRHCTEWQEFTQRAPAERLALAFASEILSQPSSMMGHLFLKVEGQSPQGHRLEHAISFYTDATTWNLPLLFYESMVEGKAGYFALSPFQDEVQKYAVREQRSLWTHQLALDASQLQRLQAHIHELRQTRITYFFQSYNCATLVRHMLAVARPDMLDGPDWWTTPKDVLRQAQHIGLISDASVQTPARWQVRSLAGSLPAQRVQQVARAIEQRNASQTLPAADMDEPTGFLSLLLAQALLRHQTTGKPTDDALNDDARRTELNQLQSQQRLRYPNLQLNADTRRDPALSPPERQAGLGWLKRGGRDHLQLRFLPVSHTLSDDNRQHFSENELRLFDSSWLVDARTGHLSLDRLTVYSVQSLLPWEPLTGGVSGRFKLGIEPQASLQRPDKKALLLEGGIGRTWRLMDDLDAYVLVGGGWGWRQSGYLYGQPEVGVVIREIWDMKTQLSRQIVTHPLGEHRPAHVWTWTQSMYLPGGHTWEWRWQRIRQKGAQGHEIGFTYKHLF